ncbi:hypothetical protein JW992_11205 [candidate division KSB1 bacterium]|nr:hypothetical protein [candidate division KSB1 bacterium]
MEKTVIFSLVLFLCGFCFCTGKEMVHYSEFLSAKNPHFLSRIKEIDAEIKRDSTSIVMLGNSITYGGNWPLLLQRPDVCNMGIISDVTAGFTSRLDQVIRSDAKICCVMGGINDLYDGQPVDSVYARLVNLVDRLQQNNLRVILHAIIAVSPRWRDARFHNALVHNLNERLADFCHSRRIDFIDLNPVLAPEGVLLERFTTDGVHLTSLAYEEWGKLLRPRLVTHE